MTETGQPESGSPEGARDGTRIRITEGDTETPEVLHRVEQMEQARRVALVRVVGEAAPGSRSGVAQAILTLTVGGAVGGLLAFLLQRVLDVPPLSDLLGESAFRSNLAFTFVLALAIGVTISLADVVMNRSWSKVGSVAAVALPSAVGAALVLGLIAHWFYSQSVDSVFDRAFEMIDAGATEAEVLAFVELRLHPLRGVAWMLVGIGAGVAAGAAARSWKRLGLAALGGAIGGFAGGFVFDFIASDEETEALAQVTGIVLLGTLIGLATALVEQAGKSRWIEIVTGGLAGKQFILYKNDITIGSSPTADITLIKDAGIMPVAAVIRMSANRCVIEEVPGGNSMRINELAEHQSPITDMDVITLSTTQIRFRERRASAKAPGALRG